MMSTQPEPSEPAQPLGALEHGNGVDLSLIRWMLGLSPEERLAVLQGFTDSAAELMNARPST